MEIREIYPGVYKSKNKLFTEPLINESVYGEKLVKINGKTLREWLPRRSKLGAAIVNGLKEFPIKKDSLVLYLGAASGTTISHVSDITRNGMVYGVEFSPIVGRQLLSLAEKRFNLVPIISDASLPESYESLVPIVDVIFQDIAQRHQVEILVRNAKKFLKRNGYAMIAVKARSIDVASKPTMVFREVRSQLEESFEILQELRLEPWEKDHAFFLLLFS